jgi:integrase
MPFEDAAREFLAYHAVNSIHPETMRSLFRVFGRTFDGRNVSEIGVRDLRAFAADRFAAGVSRATLNRYRSGLRGFFTWCIESEYHRGPNPADSLKLHRESVDETRYLSQEEYSRLILAAAAHLKPLISAAVYTGGRQGELLLLRWQDVDLHASVVTFRRRTTKGMRTRHVPLVPEARAIFVAMRRGRPDQHVFTFNEAPIKRVKTSYNRALRKAGIQGVDFRTLRHTFASWYEMNGGRTRVLKELLGHRSIQTTERYGHLHPDFVREAGAFIGPPKSRRDPASEGEEP